MERWRVTIPVPLPHPLFFVSAADKGLSVGVSGLESTVADGCVSVDSKRVCRLCGGGNCGRSGVRGRPCLGQVVEWVGRSAGDCRAERLAQLTERIGLQGWDEILRYAQDDRRGRRVRCGRWVFGERWLKLETGRGQAVEPEPDRSEDRPLHAERIRRSWKATKCAAMGPIVGLGLVVWPGRVGEPDPGAVRAWG